MKMAVLCGRFYGRTSSNVTHEQKRVFNFSIGVYDSFDKKNHFFKCVAWGKAAEIIERFHMDGEEVSVICDIKNNEYTTDLGVRIRQDKYVIREFSLIGQQARKRLAGYEENESNKGGEVPPKDPNF